MRSVLVSVWNRSQPTEEEWAIYLPEVRRAIADCRTNNDYLRFLVFTDGGAPSASQRAKTLEGGLVKGTRTAVVTANRIARGIVTAFSWFDISMKAFAPQEIVKAFEFLKVPTIQHKVILAEARRLERQIEGGVPTVVLADETFAAARSQTIARSP
jgi:hypothetical protein